MGRGVTLEVIMSIKQRRSGFLFLFSGYWLASVRGAMAAPPTFDGDWNVSLTCPATAEGRADGWNYWFTAVVKNGILHGEHGAPGEPGWATVGRAHRAER